jgi:hypothetical protein
MEQFKKTFQENHYLELKSTKEINDKFKKMAKRPPVSE